MMIGDLYFAVFLPPIFEVSANEMRYLLSRGWLQSFGSTKEMKQLN